jgi:hypothetical protein
VIITLLLASLLASSGLTGASVNAYYTPLNMSRQQFEASARFGDWKEDSNGRFRTFVLETPDATVTGRDYPSNTADDRGRSGDPHLKLTTVAEMVAFAALFSVGLLWVLPWAFGWVRRRWRGQNQ